MIDNGVELAIGGDDVGVFSGRHRQIEAVIDRMAQHARQINGRQKFVFDRTRGHRSIAKLAEALVRFHAAYFAPLCAPPKGVVIRRPALRRFRAAAMVTWPAATAAA